MSKEIDRISADISCLDTRNLPATLIPTQGAHCTVWQSGGYRHPISGVAIDLVIKRHTLDCTPREISIYHRDYLRLRGQLHEIIPTALFVRTMINGQENLLVLARAHTPWFNIANPANEEEAMPLLARLPKARRQLQSFVDVARRWQREESKVIDLYGIDNLILDKEHEVRYLDSFEVFFHEDLLHLLDEPGADLEDKINISLRRLEYLEYILEHCCPVVKRIGYQSFVSQAINGRLATVADLQVGVFEVYVSLLRVEITEQGQHLVGLGKELQCVIDGRAAAVNWWEYVAWRQNQDFSHGMALDDRVEATLRILGHKILRC